MHKKKMQLTNEERESIKDRINALRDAGGVSGVAKAASVTRLTVYNLLKVDAKVRVGTFAAVKKALKNLEEKREELVNA